MIRVAVLASAVLVMLAGIFYFSVRKTPTFPTNKEMLNAFTLPYHSQNIPALLVKKGAKDTMSSPMQINKIKLDVKVTGNMATTLMDITFYNDLDRVLDGEFCFPLGEDQTVSYFAMEMPDGLRQASVVEKAKGRIVYESIVRRQVDPALLEWTAGNNFRSRIYPIPAKGYKRIIIGFEQKLIQASNSYLYYQPFYFKDKVKEFSIRTEVYQQEIKPALYGEENVTLDFGRREENWVAEKKMEDYLPNQPLAFSVPVNEKAETVFVEENGKGNSAFYFTIQPKIIIEAKKIPSEIGLLWDMSGSSEKGDQERVLECLNAYMEKSSYPSIELVCFSNEINETISFSGSKEGWMKAIEKIKMIRPDGGTQLGCLDLTKYDADEFILVSDGLSNFGAGEIKTSSIPVYTICASSSADYSYLKYLSLRTGGSFINLNTVKQTEALVLLSSHQYQFISAEYDTSALSEVFPSQPKDVMNSFSMAGILKGKSADIVLSFGIGNKILSKENVRIENQQGKYHKMIPKIWAQTKLAELDIFYEDNEKQITSLAKEYGIVTRNTSLLVLDGIDDYLTYKVEPHDPELRKQYLARSEESKHDYLKERKEHTEMIVKEFNEWKKWYKKNYVYKKTVKPTSNDTMSIMMADTSAVSMNLEAVSPPEINSTAFAPPSPDGAYHSYTFSNGSSSNQLAMDMPVRESESMKSEIKMKPWLSDAPYMKELKKTSKKNQYQKYLELKVKHQSPSFFIDVSDHFIKEGEAKLALRILSNLAELELESPQLLRVLARRLQQLNQNTLAIEVFKDILQLREEEPQSYRDLGLAYEQNKEYQKAIDILCKVVNRTWHGRFPKIESLALVEINHIIALGGKGLRLDSLDKRLISPMPCDVRVVINWDTDNCDMDLWVEDPHKEKCFYQYPLTQSGGKMTHDFTGGYGPEVFMIKKAAKGNYKVEVNYFGTREQSLTGPTTVQADIFTNYGLPSERKRIVTLRLKEKSEVVHLADVAFGKK